ncbi:type 2A phosphatase activator TIP41 [Apiospora saccharicola]|uniref:Type 2A phosphatase activator TIP41 n=1 Tax=Apiospora saccharicola TaxID=335842 RepID=A0ABR1VB65_9PEZI
MHVLDHTQGRFTIRTRKLPISKSGAISAMESTLGIPVPEMIFGDNVVTVEHEPTGWRIEFTAHDALPVPEMIFGGNVVAIEHEPTGQRIEFNAQDALDAVDETDKNMPQVAYAEPWRSASRGDQGRGEEVRLVLQHHLQGHHAGKREHVEKLTEQQSLGTTRSSLGVTENGGPLYWQRRRNLVLREEFPKNCGHVFYLYRIFDIETQTALSPSETEDLTGMLGLKHVEVNGYCRLHDIATSQVELLQRAEGVGIFGKPREGLVYKDKDGGRFFKVISNAYLIGNGE